MSRSDARRHSFTLIFQFPFHKNMDVETLAWLKALYYDCLNEIPSGSRTISEGSPQGVDMSAVADAPIGPRPKGRDDEYINRVVWGTLEKQTQLDGVIENFLKEWTVDRINRVDLALMRLAIYEMLCEPDVPFGVAVNEAVELAKVYGTDDSPAFINGVLGNVAREIKGVGRE